MVNARREAVFGRSLFVELDEEVVALRAVHAGRHEEVAGVSGLKRRREHVVAARGKLEVYRCVFIIEKLRAEHFAAMHEVDCVAAVEVRRLRVRFAVVSAEYRVRLRAARYHHVGAAYNGHAPGPVLPLVPVGRIYVSSGRFLAAFGLCVVVNQHALRIPRSLHGVDGERLAHGRQQWVGAVANA